MRPKLQVLIMQKLPFLFFLFCILLSYNSFGQKYYYKTDSTHVEGIFLLMDNPSVNAKICQQLLGQDTLAFGPEEVKEYGFFNGQTFYSREIDINGTTELVFLERIVEGNVGLYYYPGQRGKRLFVELEGELTELTNTNGERDYRALLMGISQSCEYLRDQPRKIPFTMSAITKFIKLLNECKPRYLPRPSFGFTGGYINARLLRPEGVRNRFLVNTNFVPANSWIAGVYADIPIFREYVSLRPEIHYSTSQFYSLEVNENFIYDLFLDLSTVHLPLLIRYTAPSYRLRPFVQAGGQIGIQYFNESRFYTTTLIDSPIYGDLLNVAFQPGEEFMGNLKYSLSFGTGVHYAISPMKTLFLEIRFNRYTFPILDRNLVEQDLFFMTGISF